MYEWRQLTDSERGALLEERKRNRFPWHSPPHRDLEGRHRFLVSAACYGHAPIIGAHAARMVWCEDQLLGCCAQLGAEICAWCVLPNHYHLVVETEDLKGLRRALGVFHGRSSHRWNGEDTRRGRQVWHNHTERTMRSERHFFATLNYVHHNAVKHGLVRRWQDWPFSSAALFLEEVGRDEAQRLWHEYPLLGYGEKWDP